MNRKTKIIISITGIILILLILIGFTYGYYMVNIHGNSSNKSVEVSIGESKLEFTDLTTSNVDEIIEPGYENIKLFTVKNIGTITGKYSIYLTDVYNGFSRKEDITYTLYRKSGNNTIDTSDLSDCEVLVENAIYPSSKALVKANEKIVNQNDSYTYALKITYINSTEDQSIDQGKKFGGKIQIYAVGEMDLNNPYNEGTLSYQIIDSALNASKTSDATRTTFGTEVTEFTSISGETEKVLNNAPDDYGTSYYYRGNVIDNYVSFANKTWRIVRINGDGSIRLVLDDVAKDSSGNVMQTAFNSSSNDNAYIGYMYGMTGQSGTNINQCIKLNGDGTAAEVDTTNTTETACVQAGGKWASTPYDATHVNVVSSTIKTSLENWYKTNIVDTNNTNYIADTLFCNDKTLASNGIGLNNTALGYGNNTTYYSSIERIQYSTGTTEISTTKPTYECAKGANNTYSRFTSTNNTNTTTIKGVKLNNDLTYPIGILSADEVSFAGGYKANQENKTYYLYNSNLTSYWWLMSPSYYTNLYSYGYLFYCATGLMKQFHFAYTSAYARPAINLKASVLLNSGDGTSSNPYTVKLQ